MPAEGLVSLRTSMLLGAVLDIWGEVLECAQGDLGAYSNFFLCGGDSLQMLRVLVRVRERLGVDLPLHEAARFSTPDKMAVCCEEAGVRTPRLRPRESLQAAVATRFPCTPGQSALWLAEECGETAGAYNTALVLHLYGDLRVPLLPEALRSLLVCHEVLRTTLHFEPCARRLYAKVHELCWPVLEVSAMPAEAAHLWLQSVAAEPFDLAVGPLWRFRLVATDVRRWSLLICVHHCLIDGWAGGVLICKLAAAYNALLDKPAAAASRCDCEFRRFCVQDATPSQAAMDWWSARLQGADALRSWPDTRGQRWPFAMACDEKALDEALLAAVHAARFAARVELSAFLLTALRLAVLDLTGIEELCIGMPVSLRTSSAQEEAIGCFVNLLVLRQRVAAGMEHAALLQQGQATLSQALAHRAVPLVSLTEQLRPRLLPSGNPWCDLVFAYQNLPWQPPAFSGMQATLEPVTLSSQYPLKVEFIPSQAGCRCRIEYARGVLLPAEVDELYAALRHQLACLSDAVSSS